MKCVIRACVVVLVACGGPLRGDDKALPKGLPPRLAAVVKVDEKAGVVEYREPLFTAALPQKAGPIKEGDPAGPAAGSGVLVTIRFPLRDGTVYDTAGKKVAPADVVKRLSVGDVVLIAAGSEPVDPAYLKVVTKDVLILVPLPPGPGPALPKVDKNDK
jgi:hypothetical protein